MIPIQYFLILSAALFAAGVYGILARRNAVLILMSIELILNAVGINLIAFSTYLNPPEVMGQVFAVFVITIAAAEAGLALSIILRVYRTKSSVNVDEIDLLKW